LFDFLFVFFKFFCAVIRRSEEEYNYGLRILVHVSSNSTRRWRPQRGGAHTAAL